jgi:hypothetical protein
MFLDAVTVPELLVMNHVDAVRATRGIYRLNTGL